MGTRTTYLIMYAKRGGCCESGYEANCRFARADRPVSLGSLSLSKICCYDDDDDDEVDAKDDDEVDEEDERESTPILPSFWVATVA